MPARALLVCAATSPPPPPPSTLHAAMSRRAVLARLAGARSCAASSSPRGVPSGAAAWATLGARDPPGGGATSRRFARLPSWHTARAADPESPGLLRPAPPPRFPPARASAWAPWRALHAPAARAPGSSPDAPRSASDAPFSAIAIRRGFRGASRSARAAAKLPRSDRTREEETRDASESSSEPPSGASASGGAPLASPRRRRLDAESDERALHAVGVAVRANSAIFACKLAAYGVTGSSAMLAEAVHSVADIANQSLLRTGILSSRRAPDAAYNYGYRRERFVWSLISAVGVFFAGAGVSVMHGAHSLVSPADLEHVWVGVSVLGASAVIDAYSLFVAYDALGKNAKAAEMTLAEFVRSGRDPTSVAIVAEDAAAVAGCVVAGAAVAMTGATGNPAYDAFGSIAVGGLLGATAAYLIEANRAHLLGRSLGEGKMRAIVDQMRLDPVVSEVYGAKSEELGPGTFRFVAEIEFSGTKVVERYLDSGDGAKREQLHALFKKAAAEAAESGDPRAVDAALKMYGEEVVTAVGDEVDRIESAIVREEPSIHYVDLETN